MYRQISGGDLIPRQREAIAELLEHLDVLASLYGFEPPGPRGWATVLGKLDAVRDAMGEPQKMIRNGRSCAVVANVPRLLLADDDDGTLTVWRSPLVKHTDDIYQPVAEWLRAAPYEVVTREKHDDTAWYFGGYTETVYRRL